MATSTVQGQVDILQIPQIRELLPATAVIRQQLSVDFENDGTPEMVVVYDVPSDSDAGYHTSGLRVFKAGQHSAWSVAFSDIDTRTQEHDRTKVEKLRSRSGREGVIVILEHSGAGTATYWYVLASVRNKISRLDPAPLRKQVLARKGDQDWGYNGVTANDGQVIELQPGFSSHTARCCPDRPSLEMRFEFTGAAIRLKSVKELPFKAPES